jgi:MFS family permease
MIMSAEEENSGAPRMASGGISPDPKKRLVFGVSMTVILLGLAAFFTDVSTEMIQSIFPDYVLRVIGSGPAVLGFILGITDAISNIVKGLSGWLSERLSQRKSLIAAGYAMSNLVAKPFMGVFPDVIPVTGFKVLDRIGKGVRAAPRDALVAYVSKEKTGKAFGVYAAMDTMGAIAGPALAAVLLVLTVSVFTYESQLQFIIIFSIVPGFVSMVMIFLVKDVKQPKETTTVVKTAEKKREKINWKAVKPIILLAVIEFASLNSGFLLARGNEYHIFAVPASFLASIGMDERAFNTMVVALLYSAYNVVYAIVSIKAGNISDKVGRKKIIAIGLSLLLASTVILAITPDSSFLVPIMIPAAFLLFGLYSGFMDPTAKAMVSDLSEKKKGLTYGIYYITVGVLSIPESILFGVLYEAYGAPVAFLYEAIVLAICLVVFVIAVPETLKKKNQSDFIPDSDLAKKTS